MYAVIFEVEPKPGHRQAYLDLASRLRADLEKIEGFVSVERFASLSTEGRLVSLSFWESEEAIVRWKNHQEHQQAQQLGIREHFRDFRIRVARVERDYGMADRPPQREVGGRPVQRAVDV